MYPAARWNSRRFVQDTGMAGLRLLAASGVVMPGRFDGQDITDASEAGDEVQPYQRFTCTVCGAVRDARFAFCCELATFAPPGAPVVTPRQSQQHRGSPARRPRGR